MALSNFDVRFTSESGHSPPIDLPEDLLQSVANSMRKYPDVYDADGPIDPDNVDTAMAADFICRRPWMFTLLDGTELCPWPPPKCYGDVFTRAKKQ